MTPASVFTKIVCGVDGSPAGLEAVQQAKLMAPGDAEFTLVSVSESHLAVRTGPAAAEWTQRLNEQAQGALEEARKIVPNAETVLVHGRAADTFVRAVVDRRATVAGVGSPETSRAAGMLIGSVATLALHEAPCSVFVARVAERPGLRSIVVGVDGSDPSFAAAVVAHHIAARTGSTVQLLAARGVSPADIAIDALEKFGYDFSFSDDKPVPALLQAAREVDLLVVGSRGLTGFRALGSVSERVAHRAPCSLLVVRSF